MGYRPGAGWGGVAAGWLLTIAAAWSLGWIFTWLGTVARTAQSVQGISMMIMFPLTFLSNAFAPTERMTPVLRTLAEWNPISSLVQGVRESWGNTSPVGADAALPLQHPVLATVLWTVGLILLLAPLSIRAFQRRTSA